MLASAAGLSHGASAASLSRPRAAWRSPPVRPATAGRRCPAPRARHAESRRSPRCHRPAIRRRAASHPASPRRNRIEREVANGGERCPTPGCRLQCDRRRRAIEAARRPPDDVDRARIPSSSAGTPKGRPIFRRSPSSPVNVLSHCAVSMPPSPSRPEASSRPSPTDTSRLSIVRRRAVPCEPRRRHQLDRNA